MNTKIQKKHHQLLTAIFFQKTDDEDSGNDEPVDLYYSAERRASQTDQNSSQDSTPIVSSPSDSPDQNRAPFFPPYNNFAPGMHNNDEAANHNNDIPQNNLDPNELHLELDHLQIQQNVENYPQHDVLEEDFQSPEEDSAPVEESEPENNHDFAGLFQPARYNPDRGEPSRPWNLSRRLDLLTNYRHTEHIPVEGEPGIVERLPPEVLLAVFSHLDDVSLWCAANVCRRWRNLLSTHITPELWQKHVKLRWPLFKPAGGKVVRNWYKVYDRLASSTPCKTCLSQTSMHRTRPLRVEENSWRRNRLRIELKGLRSDPPEGIEATPLDQMCCHWQATITGPAGSPYEGGLFYLYLQVPHRYGDLSRNLKIELEKLRVFVKNYWAFVFFFKNKSIIFNKYFRNL